MAQLIKAFLISHAQRLTQRLYVRLHHRRKLGLADAADGGALVEHTDVVEVVQLAKDAEL